MNVKLFSDRFRDKFFLLSMFFIFIVSANAQKKVSGTVTSDGAPLPGANVSVKGTSTGASTDIDGKFILNVSAEAKTLVVSYLGYSSKEVQITSGEMKISLIEEKNTLDEVVVNVGYGSQKKSSITGAISSIKAKDIEQVPTGRVEQVLQGRTAGVTVAVNAGQPGSASSVRVRGVTTFGGNGVNNPLYVVDGIVLEANAIGTINQSDIESMEVLKDAASTAIYGVSAAAGVVLITTKKGKSGKMSIGYNGTFGSSTVSRKLDMLNATEYATILNEKSVAAGGSILFPNPQSYGEGTNWQNQIFSTATRENHEFNLSGGNDKSTFYSSFGYLNYGGIVSNEISNYKRTTVRLNSTHKVTNHVTVGQNFTYVHDKSVGLGNTNSEFGGPLSSALNLDPITPVVITDPTQIGSGYYVPNNQYFSDANGNPYGISPLVGQEMSNPLAYAKTRLGNYGWADDFFGNAFLEFKPIKDLTFKSVIGGKLTYYGSESFTPHFYLSPTINNTQNNISRTNGKRLDWSFENYLTYKKSFGKHTLTGMIGTGYYKNNISNGSGVTYFNIPTQNYNEASFNFDVPQSSRNSYAWDGGDQYINTSLFGRLNYDYKEKYLFTGIVRRDGSSKFGVDQKYGVFPSASVGWVVNKEDFWKENKIVNTVKLRLGWGTNGNDKPLSPNQWKATIGGGRNYTIGNDIVSGYSPNTIPNPDLKWEETTQTDIGIDIRFLNNFNLTFDYFNKVTKGILQTVAVPGYVGVDSDPWANVADMLNRGIEIELGYKKKFGDLNFSANGNFATLKNEVTNIGIREFINGAGFQSMGPITRTQVGHAYQSFYGYQTAGIFQNQSEINAYTNAAGGLIQPGAKPGDFRWSDLNGDGKIDGNDQTFLGSPLPKFTFGLTLNAEYKGFDLMVFTQGVSGNKIFKGIRRLDILNANYTKDALQRWTGEGTSNDYPRLTNDDSNGNFSKPSDFYLEDGDYFRLKLVQVGYTLPQLVTNKIGVSKIRLYVTGENLLTLTKYSGYDPEIGGDISGIDRGYYPQARTFLFGVNAQF